ncbi:hypothetical protein [Clostridium sp.]|uniref:hypothetical protein n=1 Tax=Clostridium sp. TaxID=1506 RepID=UPI0039961247
MIVEFSGYWNNDLKSFSNFIEIQEKCLKTESRKIFFSFSGCNFIAPNILVLLGGLKELIKLEGKELIFDFESIDNVNVMTYLYKTNFVKELNIHEYHNYNKDNYISYKRFDINDDNYEEEITVYVQDILKLIPINMSDELKAEITSRIYEVFINAAEHSESKIGVHACGHYFPNKRELSIAIYDGGIGIIENVRREKGHGKDAGKILEWAFIPGNTTVKNIDYNRGLGLELLKQLVKLNDGKIFTYTNNAIGVVNSKNECYNSQNRSLIGTSININIKKDIQSIYQFNKKR